MGNIFDLFKSIEKKEETSPISAIIAGLGNPGDKYQATRHNVGFMAIDYIAEQCSVKIDRAKFHAMVGEANIGSSRVLLIKPETFMNLSGEAIGEAANFYKIPSNKIIVLHDDINFDAGIIRIRRKGSAGGHNGLKSIVEHISTEFPRIKIGVGEKPNPEYDLADWVLGKLPPSDEQALKNRFPDIYEACKLIVNGRIDDAMARFPK